MEPRCSPIPPELGVTTRALSVPPEDYLIVAATSHAARQALADLDGTHVVATLEFGSVWAAGDLAVHAEAEAIVQSCLKDAAPALNKSRAQPWSSSEAVTAWLAALRESAIRSGILAAIQPGSGDNRDWRATRVMVEAYCLLRQAAQARIRGSWLNGYMVPGLKNGALELDGLLTRLSESPRTETQELLEALHEALQSRLHRRITSAQRKLAEQGLGVMDGMFGFFLECEPCEVLTVFLNDDFERAAAVLLVADDEHQRGAALTNLRNLCVHWLEEEWTYESSVAGGIDPDPILADYMPRPRPPRVPNGWSTGPLGLTGPRDHDLAAVTGALSYFDSRCHRPQSAVVIIGSEAWDEQHRRQVAELLLEDSSWAMVRVDEITHSADGWTRVRYRRVTEADIHVIRGASPSHEQALQRIAYWLFPSIWPVEFGAQEALGQLSAERGLPKSELLWSKVVPALLLAGHGLLDRAPQKYDQHGWATTPQGETAQIRPLLEGDLAFVLWKLAAKTRAILEDSLREEAAVPVFNAKKRYDAMDGAIGKSTEALEIESLAARDPTVAAAYRRALAHSSDPGAEVEGRLQVQELLARARLTAAETEVLELHFGLGLEPREIALRRDLKPDSSTPRVQLHNALTKLRQLGS